MFMRINDTAEDVIREARVGNPAALATIFNAHKRTVFWLCLRVSQSAAEAENLTERIFLQAFRNLDSLPKDTGLSTWLFHVAAGEALGYLRGYTCRFKSHREIPHEVPTLMSSGERFKLPPVITGLSRF